MTTGFGFCPNCGAAMTEAGQRFCAACGFTLSGAAASAAVPPPAPVAPAPPPWAVPPGAPVGAAPAQPAISPAMLLIGALVIAAIVAVGFFAMNNGSKASSSASASHGTLFGSSVPTASSVPSPVVATSPTQGTGAGAVTFKPSTFSCSDSSTQVTLSVWLPGSVSASDQVTGELDGVQVSTRVVGDDFKKQSDGRWLRSDTDTAANICGAIGAGKHVYRVLDSEGNLLAQGSFTTTGVAATPTPAGGGGSVTFEPSSFSCSDTSTQVTMTIVLPASLSASAEVTAELDGQKYGTDTVSTGFTKQSDGRWLSTASDSASTVCSDYGSGAHTLSVLDSQDNVLATGSFTANQ